jgi:LacI family transcriptional regulator
MWTASVTSGIGKALHAQQFHLLLYMYQEGEEPPPAAFLDGRVDGLIVLAPHTDDILPQQLAQDGLPVIIVGAHGVEGTLTASVDADNLVGASRAVAYLIGLGHTRIAHLQGPDAVPNAIDRRLGYEQTLREHGLPVRPEYLIEAGFGLEGGQRAAEIALRLEPRPTALFVANDVAALGALRACSEQGVRVPEEVSVVGYDDAPVCELARPSLTTMRQPAREMGLAAAEMLLDMLKDGVPPAEPRRIFPAELVVRDSSGVPPS